jgi:hypothetical protein
MALADAQKLFLQISFKFQTLSWLINDYMLLQLQKYILLSKKNYMCRSTFHTDFWQPYLISLSCFSFLVENELFVTYRAITITIMTVIWSCLLDVSL